MDMLRRLINYRIIIIIIIKERFNVASKQAAYHFCRIRATL